MWNISIPRLCRCHYLPGHVTLVTLSTTKIGEKFIVIFTRKEILQPMLQTEKIDPAQVELREMYSIKPSQAGEGCQQRDNGKRKPVCPLMYSKKSRPTPAPSL
jgi:hypothetical protein